MGIEIEINDQDLPVLSVIATQALELIHHPNVTHQKLENLIRQDPSLTSRLLHIANSVFYATRMESRSISDAARKLGMRQLNNIILAAATGELFSAEDPHAQGLWDHAQQVASAAQLLAEELKVSHAEEAYVAGLLHDIGKIIIYRQHPQLYADMMAEAAQSGRPLYEVEIEQFRFFTHMSIGGLVVRKWRLSDSIAESARFHHDLLRIIPREMSNAGLACTVALANVAMNHLAITGQTPDPVLLEPLACTQRLDLGRDRLAQLMLLLMQRCPVKGMLQPEAAAIPGAEL